jgi:hypothetical protein
VFLQVKQNFIVYGIIHNITPFHKRPKFALCGEFAPLGR